MTKIYQLWKERFADKLLETHDSKYHKEGNILTHTLMVYNEVINETADYDNLFDETTLFKIAALLHDVGKPLSVTYENGRKLFRGHEGLSTFLSVSYLKELKSKGLLTTSDIWDILFIINAHGNLMKYRKSKKHWIKYRYETEKLDWLYQFNKYDVAGRISEDVYELPKAKVKSERFNKEYDKDKPFVVMPIGVPSIGKSSWMKDNLREDIEVLSRDEILIEYGKENGLGSGYSEIWYKLTDEMQKEIDERFRDRLNELQKEDKSFCIDMTLVSYKSRRKMLGKIKHNYQIYYANFIADYEDIMDRNKIRGKEAGKYIPEDVIRSFMKKYQFPLLGEDNRIIDIENILL